VNQLREGAMSKVRDLLIEIGTEELPPKALLRLSNAFRDNLREELEKAELTFADIRQFASPRRLALIVSDLEEQQADKKIDRRGPALQAAFDEDGKPTQAALGFAKSCGIDINDVEKIENEKGAWLFYQITQKGLETRDLIADLVNNALHRLPIPKRMRWADLDAQFVRPVHWSILLFGKDVIDGDILSVKSGQLTYGHRFHHPDAIKIKQPADYESKLEKGKVIADFEKRRQSIVKQIERIAGQKAAKAVIEKDLLDEVTSMVEWPVAILGDFEKRFLDVPQEALISTMSEHQKYFHLIDRAGMLLPHFITVANIKSKDMQKVIEGNERVIRPRFTDAEFFWNQDRKHTLESHIDSTKSVIFQKQMGSLFDKTERVAQLSVRIADQIGGDPSMAKRAAELSKCDLMSEMVYEFPELQGIMGRYYASHDREPAEVAQAIDEHYMPRFAGDELPETRTGQAVAIADRLDTLLGIIAAGQMPTGDKDPYALRRAALGVLRIMIEGDLSLDLDDLLKKHAETMPGKLKAANAVDSTVDYILERLKTYYLDKDIKVDVYDSVKSQRPTQPNDFDARVLAVTEFQSEEGAASLAAANKRISNILKKSDEAIPDQIDPSLLSEDAENRLANQVLDLSSQVQPLIAKRDYTAILRLLASLKDNVDSFFDHVMVNVDDTRLRQNRLALLNQLRNLFLDVADISKLQSGN
jgi:glycyl-tRNA synthetase beta chain